MPDIAGYYINFHGWPKTFTSGCACKLKNKLLSWADRFGHLTFGLQDVPETDGDSCLVWDKAVKGHEPLQSAIV